MHLNTFYCRWNGESNLKSTLPTFDTSGQSDVFQAVIAHSQMRLRYTLQIVAGGYQRSDGAIGCKQICIARRCSVLITSYKSRISFGILNGTMGRSLGLDCYVHDFYDHMIFHRQQKFQMEDKWSEFQSVMRCKLCKKKRKKSSLSSVFGHHHLKKENICLLWCLPAFCHFCHLLVLNEQFYFRATVR